MALLKEELYRFCIDFVNNRESEIKRVIAEAQEAANNETKSSAGDKYETGREVIQQEINLNLARLNELGKLRATLEHITPTQTGSTALPGSVVYTNNGNFYIAIGAGKITIAGTSFFAISAASPIGSKLLGKEEGYSLDLNGKKFVIEKII
jgi:transcription elongation GreA/GreB family factor